MKRLRKIRIKRPSFRVVLISVLILLSLVGALYLGIFTNRNNSVLVQQNTRTSSLFSAFETASKVFSTASKTSLKPTTTPAPTTSSAPTTTPKTVTTTPVKSVLGITAKPKQPVPTKKGSYACNCSRKCHQIASCDEVYYQVNVCGCSHLYTKPDKVPCANYACKSR